MARRKDAVALFEVITATKRKQEAAAAASHSAPPPALRTPKWWFKSRSAKPQQSDTIDEHSFTPAALPPAHYQQHPQLSLPAEDSSGLLSQSVVQRVSQSPQPQRVTIPERSQGGDPFGLDIPDAADAPARSRRSWRGFGAKKIAVDPDRREVTVRFRYTTAIIVGFAVCVAIGLAYMGGRQTNNAAAGPNRITSEQVRRGAINANVLDIRSGRDGADAEPAPPTNDDDLARPASDRRPAPPASEPKSGAAAISNAPGVEKGLPRQNGLNYVIVQSYDDEKSAVEVVKALDAVGITCTIERKLNGWSTAENRYIVVGIDGFARRKNSPEYDAYIKAIEKVGKRLSATTKSKPFELGVYKWKLQ
jgi:hypothetical protein